MKRKIILYTMLLLLLAAGYFLLPASRWVHYVLHGKETSDYVYDHKIDKSEVLQPEFGKSYLNRYYIRETIEAADFPTVKFSYDTLKKELRTREENQNNE